MILVTNTISKGQRWAAYGLSGLAILFLTFDTAMKIVQNPMALQGTTELGYPATAVFTIGLIQLACLVLYVLPPTAVLGAVLFTGYLGGAVATHLRLGNPLLTHQLFPLYVAALLWGGLYLREPRLRALLPLRR